MLTDTANHSILSQYYDMPRKPGDRIESAQTLGRKCWAFTYLQTVWEQGLERRNGLDRRERAEGEDGQEVALRGAVMRTAARAGWDLADFVQSFDDAIPLTMDLCWEVMANCFVNASYDPARNGTCPGSLEEFRFGFQRENLKRRSPLPYPFGY